MKRRDFLKRFGIGAAAVVAAPSLIKAVEPEPDFTTTRYDLPDGKVVHLADMHPEQVLETWKETGNILYHQSPHNQGRAIDLWTQAQAEADFMLKQSIDQQIFLGTPVEPSKHIIRFNP